MFVLVPTSACMLETLLAPAKINLFLHVVARRADGLHDLQTIFQLLDFGDSLRLQTRRSPGLDLHCYGWRLPAADNLVRRAAERLADACQVKEGVDIELYKRVPPGTGLGGGSSDAAAVLHGLNRLWRCHLSVSELATLGAGLGADVPVFVYGHSAWGEGIGDVLRPLTPPAAWYVVLIPPFQVSTAELYADLRESDFQAPVTIDDYRLGRTSNVFEALLIKRHPQVAELLDWLGTYAPARLSGTGASVFAAFADGATARQVFFSKPNGVGGFLCRGLAASPCLGDNRGQQEL